MKTIITKVATALIMVLLFSACEKDEIEVYKLSLQVNYPEALNNMPAIGLDVSVQNTITGNTTVVKTDNSGMVTIDDLTPGTYNINASVKVTRAEYEKITGVNDEMEFTFNLMDFAVNGEMAPNQTVILVAKPISKLLISEVYDSPPIENGMKEAYIELYNNSDEPIVLDGLCIASLGGPRSEDDGAPWGISDFIFAETLIRIPGAGKDHVLQPGEFFLLAANARQFNYKVGEKEMLSVDLNDADMEVNSLVYNNERGLPEGMISSINTFFDFDNPMVSNAEIKHLSHSWWFLMPGGSSIVLFRTEKEFTDTQLEGKFMGVKIPIADIQVIDAVDFLYSTQSADYKRLPKAIDHGFTHLMKTDYYLRKSVSRKHETDENGKIRLLDSNNSSNDFEETEPSPNKL